MERTNTHETATNQHKRRFFVFPVPLRVPDSVWSALPRKTLLALTVACVPWRVDAWLFPPNGMEGALPTLRATTDATVKACLFLHHPPQRKQRKTHLHSVWPPAKPKKPHHNEPQAVTKKPCGYGAKRNPVKLTGSDEKAPTLPIPREMARQKLTINC